MFSPGSRHRRELQNFARRLPFFCVISLVNLEEMVASDPRLGTLCTLSEGEHKHKIYKAAHGCRRYRSDEVAKSLGGWFV